MLFRLKEGYSLARHFHADGKPIYIFIFYKYFAPLGQGLLYGSGMPEAFDIYRKQLTSIYEVP
jgi:hypothetical protein